MNDFEVMTHEHDKFEIVKIDLGPIWPKSDEIEQGLQLKMMPFWTGLKMINFVTSHVAMECT